MRIIAFGYKRRVGKDTAVKFALNCARQYFPQIQCQRLSFGDQLKKISVQMFSWAGLQDAVYYDNHPEEREVVLPAAGLSPRQIWDELGSFGAKLCPKVWPEMALKYAEADILFCGDMRRPVEAEYVRAFKGKCYKIIRDKAPVSNHSVDTSLDTYDSWDGIIENNDSQKEFNTKIKQLTVRLLNEGVDQGFLVCPSCFSRGKAIMRINGQECGHCGGRI